MAMVTRDGYRVRSGAIVWLEVIECSIERGKISLADSPPTVFRRKWVTAVVTQNLEAVYCTETNMFYPTSSTLSFCPEVVSERTPSSVEGVQGSRPDDGEFKCPIPLIK